MAALTPDEILKISAPIEEIYARTVDDLLINIAKHFKSGAKDTAKWEVQKLAEMGALTQESALIIAKNTGQEYTAVYDAFMEAARVACIDIDPQLQRAIDRGVLPSGNTTAILRESPAMQEMVSAYVEQATDKLNLTNTTMLESTRQEYLRAVTSVANEERLAEAKKIIETQSLEAATAQETRPRAIRKAMDQLSERGITGFYDKSGRQWSAEAYSAMVVRTTAHNTAIQAVRTRQAEAGAGDVFQVSTHPGARPGCYPYQQLFYSWGSGSGTFVDGAGNKHRYEPIQTTTYGEPAGLFGINCGHHPIPMIPGFSFPQDEPIQSEAENDKLYEQSQEQRAYERDIRKAKRDLEMAKATGDEQAIKDAERKVKDSQARMRQFIKDTDGVRRYDRERIGGGGGRVSGISTPKTAPAQVPQAGITADTFKNTRGITDEFRKGMAEVLDKAPREDVKALYAKYADDLVVTDPNAKRGAFFSSGKGGVTMNLGKVAAGNNYETPYEVAFHEFGHMIDYLMGGKNAWTYASNANGHELEGIIKSDYQAFKKSLGVTKNADVIDKLAAEGMDKLTSGNISDILEKCTNKSYPLGIGHGVGYHRREGSTEREFFAEVLDSAVSNPASYAQLNRLFPNAINKVWDIVGEDINK